ncbi:MAG: flagellar assembly protein FliH [Arcobacteraceae bacterium]|nr:flagellar assembly protein FliH [Arcobacteraceae bacterium]
MNNNVNSTARIISPEATETYSLGTFLNNPAGGQTQAMQEVAPLNDKSINGNIDPVLIEIQKLTSKLNNIEQKVVSIENDGIKGKDLDKQLIQALKDLKNYASFFEQATFQLETKILKTSMSIAKKIIGVELGEQSASIAKITIENILNKIKTASQITIHLNPKDYLVLKDELNLDDFIKLQEDQNVTAGGVVIASDLGNFDGNIAAKVETILESLDTIM